MHDYWRAMKFELFYAQNLFVKRKWERQNNGRNLSLYSNRCRPLYGSQSCVRWGIAGLTGLRASEWVPCAVYIQQCIRVHALFQGEKKLIFKGVLVNFCESRDWLKIKATKFLSWVQFFICRGRVTIDVICVFGEYLLLSEEYTHFFLGKS
jgi:hypothetical protein